VRRERVAVVAWKSIVDRALRPAKVEGAGEREPGDADPGPAADASSLREGYLSSQTSSMRQPLKMLLIMIVCPLT
jgi:hypothetical protein